MRALGWIVTIVILAISGYVLFTYRNILGKTPLQTFATKKSESEAEPKDVREVVTTQQAQPDNLSESARLARVKEEEESKKRLLLLTSERKHAIETVQTHSIGKSYVRAIEEAVTVEQVRSLLDKFDKEKTLSDLVFVGTGNGVQDFKNAVDLHVVQELIPEVDADRMKSLAEGAVLQGGILVKDGKPLGQLLIDAGITYNQSWTKTGLLEYNALTGKPIRFRQGATPRCPGCGEWIDVSKFNTIVQFLQAESRGEI